MGARKAGDGAQSGMTAAGMLVLVVVFAAPVSAQQGTGPVRALSLADAMRLAEDASESVAMARAGVLRSDGELKRARSEYFPQLFASASYTRTLDSEFRAFSSGSQSDSTASSEPCGTFTPDPAMPLGERVDSLEAAVRCQSQSDPFSSFSDLPFGRENQWRLDLSLSQTVFSGGRVGAQTRAARAGRRMADLDLASSRASLMLDVAGAYYDAVLADRLFEIAQSTLAQAETTLAQIRLAKQVGSQPEFELLRAQVTRDNQQPVVIRRRADRTLAHMRLKQLLDLSPDQPIELTSDLDGSDIVEIVRLATDVVGVVPDTLAETRSPVRQAMESVHVQEAQLTIARAQRLPALSLNMQYGRVGYPENVTPFDARFRTNWTVGASIQLPLFTGGRLAGESLIARANLDEARARLDMTRELASLDTRDALERLAAAQSAWEASSGTVQQANRAYSIAEVRFSEGISTQLELNDSRILLEQAQANRAQAAREFQLARLRVALLPYLPLSGGGSAAQPASATTRMNMRPTIPATTAGAPASRTGATTSAAAARQTGAVGGR